jgi:DGQHR domain-containing protein
MAQQSIAIDHQFDLVAPAQRFTQGGRYVYSFILDLPTLDRLMPDRVDENVIKEANRRLTASHAAAIQDYLEKQDKWLLGTLLMGVNPDAVDFQAWQDTTMPVVAGQLRVLTTGEIKIFDGQHRRRAIKNALKSLSGDRLKASKPSYLQGASVPIMLYAESSIGALRQMFADAAQTKTIERNTVAQFDRQDAFNVAAEQLFEISELLAGRVEMERPSVARTSPNIISINQLAAALKVLEVGIKGRVSKERNSQYLANVDDLVDRCHTWSDEFMPAAREEYDKLLSGEIDNSEIPESRSRTMAFNATVVRILAGCYHQWGKDNTDWQPLADFIRAASLKPGAGNGALLVDAGAVIPGGISPIGRQMQMAAAVDYIVQQAKIAVS